MAVKGRLQIPIDRGLHYDCVNIVLPVSLLNVFLLRLSSLGNHNIRFYNVKKKTNAAIKRPVQVRTETR